MPPAGRAAAGAPVHQWGGGRDDRAVNPALSGGSVQQQQAGAEAVRRGGGGVSQERVSPEEAHTAGYRLTAYAGGWALVCAHACKMSVHCILLPPGCRSNGIRWMVADSEMHD
jgi:hypothetical protein